MFNLNDGIMSCGMQLCHMVCLVGSSCQQRCWCCSLTETAGMLAQWAIKPYPVTVSIVLLVMSCSRWTWNSIY
jgi:hypothetical protein